MENFLKNVWLWNSVYYLLTEIITEISEPEPAQALDTILPGDESILDTNTAGNLGITAGESAIVTIGLDGQTIVEPIVNDELTASE